ncbi:hypothetical protein M0804_000942 [Polistes exclamans]|nr:hypothetical protein M0804_000942 [Polistes exclamans]
MKEITNQREQNKGLEKAALSHYWYASNAFIDAHSPFLWFHEQNTGTHGVKETLAVLAFFELIGAEKRSHSISIGLDKRGWLSHFYQREGKYLSLHLAESMNAAAAGAATAATACRSSSEIKLTTNDTQAESDQ